LKARATAPDSAFLMVIFPVMAIFYKTKICLRKKGQQVNEGFVISAQGSSGKYSLTND